MLDLTIAICTIRDPEHFLRPTLDEISRCSKGTTKYEVLVYGPQHCFIEHPEKPKYFQEIFRHGNVYGYNMLAAMAGGRNIAFLTDDMHVPENLFDIIDFMDRNNEKFNVHGFKMHDGQDYSPFPNKLILKGMGWHEDCLEKIVDSVAARYGRAHAHSPIPLIRFIAATKVTIDIMMRGYLFHPAFHSGGGDQWLSIWAWYYGQKLWEKLPCLLAPREGSPSVLTERERDGETLRDLVWRLSKGYDTYV